MRIFGWFPNTVRSQESCTDSEKVAFPDWIKSIIFVLLSGGFSHAAAVAQNNAFDRAFQCKWFEPFFAMQPTTVTTYDFLSWIMALIMFFFCSTSVCR